jgi:thiol-disulfide isomerase/thioredoxin
MMIAAAMLIAAVTADPAPPRVQWRIVTASWCGPCKAAVADFRPKFEKAKWVVSDAANAQIQLVDFDTNPAFVKEYDVQTVPQFFLFVNGQVVERHYRYPGGKRLGEAYNEESERWNQIVLKGAK